MERYAAQTQLLGRAGIDTLQQLKEYQKAHENTLEQLSHRRKELRNQLRAATRAGRVQQADALKEQIANLSSQMKQERREVGLCNEIEQRSMQVATNLEELDAQLVNKEETKDERIRGGSGSGRQDDAQRC